MSSNGRRTLCDWHTHTRRATRTPQAVSCVNLVNQHGSEGTLEAGFASEAAR